MLAATLDQLTAVVAPLEALLARAAFDQFAIRTLAVALAFGGFAGRACPGQVALAVAAILGLAGLATRGVDALLTLAHVADRLGTTAFGETRGVATLRRLTCLLRTLLSGARLLGTHLLAAAFGVAACPDLAIAGLFGALARLLADLGLASCLLRFPLAGLALPGLRLADRSLPLLGRSLGLVLRVAALVLEALVLALLLGTRLFGLAARFGTRICAVVLFSPVAAFVAVATAILCTGRRLQAEGEQCGEDDAHRAV